MTVRSVLPWAIQWAIQEGEMDEGSRAKSPKRQLIRRRRILSVGVALVVALAMPVAAWAYFTTTYYNTYQVGGTTSWSTTGFAYRFWNQVSGSGQNWIQACTWYNTGAQSCSGQGTYWLDSRQNGYASSWCSIHMPAGHGSQLSCTTAWD